MCSFALLDLHLLESRLREEDMPKSASPILVYGGATCESSPSEAQPRKVVRLEEMKFVII